MKNIQIIKAEEQYAESYCKAVDTVARERKYLAATKGFPLDSTRDFVKMIVQNNLSQFYAIIDTTVIGWCDILPNELKVFRHVADLGMGIVPEYRGQGIGARLMEKAIKHAKEHNRIEKVEIGVFESNTNAIQFYTRNGFLVEGKRIKSRKIDNEYDNIVLMGKEV